MNRKPKQNTRKNWSGPPKGDSDIIAIAREAKLFFFCKRCKKTVNAHYGRDWKVRCKECDNLGIVICRAHAVQHTFKYEEEAVAKAAETEKEDHEKSEMIGAIEKEVVKMST